MRVNRVNRVVGSRPGLEIASRQRKYRHSHRRKINFPKRLGGGGLGLRTEAGIAG